MFIAGLDIGTTGSKCTVYNDLGEYITEVYKEYSVSISKGAHTVNVNLIWQTVITILKEIAFRVTQFLDTETFRAWITTMDTLPHTFSKFINMNRTFW